MRFLPTAVHGIVDYVWGVALIAAPFVLGFAPGGAAQWVAIVFGGGAILYSLVTAYEAGLVRILPMEAHLVLDGAAGAVLAASPWLFGFADQVAWPHLAFGLFSVGASLVTHTRPSGAVHAHSRP
jgi:hypothetical protein